MDLAPTYAELAREVASLQERLDATASALLGASRKVAELRADKERPEVDWELFKGFVAGFRITGPAPIGPLFGAGWNGAVNEILLRIDGAIDATREATR